MRRQSRLRRMRAPANFLNQINAIPPVQSPSAKIFRFSLAPNQIHNYRIPSHRGAFRDRHGRWCGMRWTRERRETSAATADGEVVWSWRPDAGAKLAEVIPPMTVAKEPGHRGELEGNR